MIVFHVFFDGDDADSNTLVIVVHVFFSRDDLHSGGKDAPFSPVGHASYEIKGSSLFLKP